MNYKIAAVAALILGSLTVSLRADIIEQVLVKVNGEIITKSDLEARQINALRQKNPNFRPANDAELKKALEDVTPGVIVEAVDELLMVQRGKELGYTMSNEQFAGILENIKKENKIESDEQLQAALKQENMTMADLRRNMERQMLVSRVQQQEVSDKIGVTDDEARAYYAGHRGEFTTPADISQIGRAHV